MQLIGHQSLDQVRPLSNLYVAGGFVLTFLMVLINAADFQGADPDAFKVSKQIYVRLAICGMCGIYGMFSINSSVARYFVFPGVLILAYGMVAFLTVPISVNWQFSMVAVICLWCLFLFLPAAIDQLGNDRFLITVALGAAVYVVVSWGFYFLLPEVGVWREFITKEDYLDRMGGLGHPNTLGFYAGAVLLFATIFARKGMLPWIYVGLWAILWAATMYFCLSRTSLVLTVIGFASIMADRILQPRHIPKFVVIVAIGLACLFFLELTVGLETLAGKSLRSVSKSGDTAELTSLTGRSEIWKYGISRIAEKPLTGYGYGTQRFVMDEHFYHCHNIVLNATLGCGLFAGLAMISGLGYLLFRLFRPTDYFLRGFIPLFLIGGMVESMIFSPAPSLEMMLFFALICWQVDQPKQQYPEWQYEEAWGEWH